LARHPGGALPTKVSPLHYAVVENCELAMEITAGDLIKEVPSELSVVAALNRSSFTEEIY
jgi:hypothetical protein